MPRQGLMMMPLFPPRPRPWMMAIQVNSISGPKKKKLGWSHSRAQTDHLTKQKKNPAHCDAWYYNQQSIQTNGVMVRYVCDGAVCMAKVVAHGKTAAACGVQLLSTLMNQTITITGLVLPQKSRADSENKCNLSVQLQTYMNSLLIVL